MKIDHIGYVVKNIYEAIKQLEVLGFQFGSVVNDTDRNIQISFGKNGNYCVELVCPLAQGKDSPADIYLSKIGPTPYHVCYQSENLENDIETLKRQGFKLIVNPASAAAFGGRRVAFMASLGTGLMEIVEV